MRAAAAPAPHQVGDVVRKMKADLKEFARCMQRAKAAKSADERRSLVPELARGREALQSHRAQVRSWTTRGTSLDKASLGALASVRTDVESELQKMRTLEKELAKGGISLESCSKASSAPPQPGNESQGRLLRTESEGSGWKESEDRTSSPSGSLSPAVGPQAALADAEAKVLADQICGTEAEKERASEFVCQICLVHVVGDRPKLTKCSHLFCGDCMAQWMTSHRGNQTWAGRMNAERVVPCPVCKEPLRGEGDLHEIRKGGPGGSGLVWKMLSSIKVTCANNPNCNPDGRCDWVGDLGSYRDHFLSCKNEPVYGLYAQETTSAQESADTMQAIDEPNARVACAAAESEQEQDTATAEPASWGQSVTGSDGGSEEDELASGDGVLGEISVLELRSALAEDWSALECGRLSTPPTDVPASPEGAGDGDAPIAPEEPESDEQFEAALGDGDAGQLSQAEMARLQRAHVEHLPLAQWQQEQARMAYARDMYARHLAQWQMAQAYQHMMNVQAARSQGASAAWAAHWPKQAQSMGQQKSPAGLRQQRASAPVRR